MRSLWLNVGLGSSFLVVAACNLEPALLGSADSATTDGAGASGMHMHGHGGMGGMAGMAGEGSGNQGPDAGMGGGG